MRKGCIFTNSAACYLQEYREILNQMIQGMNGAEWTDSISHNFIVQMIPHHRAAIEMSKNILRYTENNQLGSIAERIISEQTKSIENMLKIKYFCEKMINSCEEVNAYQCRNKQVLETMFSDMNKAYSDNCIDCDFIREMIPHHLGAVRMSKNTLCFPICAELTPILDAIITSQEKGICQMQKLSHCLHCIM